MSSLRLAVGQVAIGFYQRFDDWAEEQRGLVAAAAAQGAQMAVFPEYASMALASALGPAVYGDLHAQLAAVQTLHDSYLAVHRELATRHGLYLLAGSFPVRLDDGTYRNRAYFFGPEGGMGFQDKIQMTRFEREDWDIRGGDDLEVFETAHGMVAVNICYDVEFPLLARHQVEAGAMLLLCPSCTETRAGYERVRLGGRARAMENQIFVAHAPTVGHAAWSPAVDVNVGRAAVYGPVDQGFPQGGVLVEGEYEDGAAEARSRWVYADLDLDELARVRREGQVLNHRDWPGQKRVRQGSRHRL